jgi:SpoVK/Ycf46/Vps4 family AAA+-type ATPase
MQDFVFQLTIILFFFFFKCKENAPCILFFDEIDSLGLSRERGEEDSSARRLLSELLIQMSNLLEGENHDTSSSSSSSTVIVIAATNRLEDLDPAIQRRFNKRIFVGKLNKKGRKHLITHCLKNIQHNLSTNDINIISLKLKNWSGSDIYNVCREAAFRPIRRYHQKQLQMRKQQEQGENVCIDDNYIGEKEEEEENEEEENEEEENEEENSEEENEDIDDEDNDDNVKEVNKTERNGEKGGESIENHHQYSSSSFSRDELDNVTLNDFIIAIKSSVPIHDIGKRKV